VSQTVDEFAAEAKAWLAENGERRRDDLGADAAADEVVWGDGEFSVSVFHNMSHETESAHLERLRSWNQRKAEQNVPWRDIPK
jgi:methylase of polypeptide subunit release factors